QEKSAMLLRIDSVEKRMASVVASIPFSSLSVFADGLQQERNERRKLVEYCQSVQDEVRGVSRGFTTFQSAMRDELSELKVFSKRSLPVSHATPSSASTTMNPNVIQRQSMPSFKRFSRSVSSGTLHDSSVKPDRSNNRHKLGSISSFKGQQHSIDQVPGTQPMMIYASSSSSSSSSVSEKSLITSQTPSVPQPSTQLLDGTDIQEKSRPIHSIINNSKNRDDEQGEKVVEAPRSA
ncbi:hypothetical protein ADUPG1_002683, partial [Aduncisulcus paluster]